MAEYVLVRVQLPLPRILGADWDDSLHAARDKLLVPPAERNDLLDGDHLDVVLLGKALEIGHARHGAVDLHELGDHARGVQAGQYRQVHCGLGLTRAREYAALRRSKWKAVACNREVSPLGSRVEDLSYRCRAVVGRRPGRDVVLGVD